ncbi:Uma2 family endonuclease [Saccharopolyspora phatthalungensis]|uniref:Uma2 family endonuclease n=1 Tax=Saccharopolyspora phatthalungensis TaxID=664693 RepID=A0A840PZ25_9PSEU|nr:Uma2 family endonuclease [Saccharopolyspora phatthalungensis]MBB5153000.1 Uma2 family endonuclease [Saccharopolyspora phatthalungensis]
MSIDLGGRRFTVQDLEAIPEDGRRYELIDGELLVSPAPGWPHQEAVGSLFVRLHRASPPEYRVLPAPFPVRQDLFTELRPDVVVARYAELTLRNLQTAPVLAVEVASPSSRLNDISLRKAAHARLGTQHFWLVDPDLEVPTVTAWELVGGSDYQRVARVVGDELFEPLRPFPVRFAPVDLVAGLRP